MKVLENIKVLIDMKLESKLLEDLEKQGLLS